MSRLNYSVKDTLESFLFILLFLRSIKTFLVMTECFIFSASNMFFLYNICINILINSYICASPIHVPRSCQCG